MKKNSKSEEFQQLTEELKKLKRKLTVSHKRYDEIYYSKTWQAFLFTRKLIEKIKKKFSSLSSPPLRIINLPGILKKEMIDPQKLVIINLPLINWQRKKQRPQHFCQQFAKDGNLVFYINNHFIAQYKRELSKDQIVKKLELKKLEERIYQASLVSFQDLAIDKDRVENIWDKKYISWSLETLLRVIGKKRKIIKIDCPFWYTFVKNFKNFLIYDCFDEFSGFWRPDSILKLEPLLAKRADVVLVTSDVLYKKMKKFNKNCFLVENAAEFIHFSQKPKSIPGDMKFIKHPIIGYYGAIGDWFDGRLLLYLSGKRPNWQFVLLGNISDPTKIEYLKGVKNIYFLGEKPYKDLPSYLNLFDVCFIPFVKNTLTKAVNPIKFFEYLSAGKPVVSADLPEIEKYQKYSYIAKDKKDFLEKIEKALKENSKTLINQRIDFAKKNTWQARFKKIKNIIKKFGDE